MNLLLQGQVALITGSSRGIGLAVAEMLAQEGVKVVMNGVNEKRLAEAVSLLNGKNLSVTGIPGDVSDRDTAERIFDDIAKKFERFDILINNAGIYPHGLNMLDMTEQDWDQAVSINLKSIFNCSRLAAQAMITHGNGGVILNATSFGAKMPSWGTLAYAATKAAISNMTMTMAAELAPYEIRVNSYMPGVIATDMTEAVRKENEDLVLAQIAMRRVGQPSEVAAPLVFLASPLASYITGANLEITGGKFAVQNPAQAWQQ